jgi:hypothetical protein
MNDFQITPDQNIVTLNDKKYLFVNTGDKTTDACTVCDLNKHCNDQFPCLTSDKQKSEANRIDGKSGIFKLSAV